MITQDLLNMIDWDFVFNVKKKYSSNHTDVIKIIFKDKAQLIGTLLDEDCYGILFVYELDNKKIVAITDVYDLPKNWKNISDEEAKIIIGKSILNATLFDNINDTLVGKNINGNIDKRNMDMIFYIAEGYIKKNKPVIFEVFPSAKLLECVKTEI